MTSRIPHPRLLVVVPTYNEAASVESITTRIRSAVPSADVLVVDDDSPDGTGAIADGIAERDAHVRVLHRAVKDGLGRAYLAGFAVALRGEYDLIAEIDADGSHDPAELAAMVDIAAGEGESSGADLVIGSRWVPGGAVENWPRRRRAISRIANRYAAIMLRTRIRDITAGFRVFRADALREIHLDDVASAGYCFQIDLAWRVERAGMRVVEHPIRFTERTEGRSKMTLGIVLESLWRVTVWGLTPPSLPKPGRGPDPS
jgi:dolichol-phosphate mannosyltransferase